MQLPPLFPLLALGGALLLASPLPAPAEAQGRAARGGQQMTPGQALRLLFGDDETPGNTVLPEGTVFWVEAPQPVHLASLRRGQFITLNILALNPRSQVASAPVRSNAAPGLPPGCKLRAQVVELKAQRVRGQLQRTAVVIVNQLVLAGGQVVPFLGALSASDDGNLPGWLEKRRYALKDKAASAEGLALAMSWASEVGALGIGAAVLGTKMYQNNKIRKEEARMSVLMALSSIDGDLVPQRTANGRTEKPKFFVIATRGTRF